MELTFEVHHADEGGFWARALNHAIFTQADTWHELCANIREVTVLHFEQSDARPRIVTLKSRRPVRKPSA